MAGKRRMLLWGYIYRIPMLEHLPSLVLPVGLTVAFTLLIDLSLRQIPALAAYSTALTLLLSVLVFFIILWLQNILLAVIFSGALHDFLARTRGRHPVTKRFGAEILRRFLSDGFKEDMIKGVESLSTMLEKIEQRNGHPLAPTCYAILLDKAAEAGPDRLWAVWDFDVVPIEEVFDSAGNAKPDYAFYFETLSKIYARIENEKDKERVFVFTDDDHMNAVMSHPGWPTLLKFHKDSGFNHVYRCLFGTVKTMKQHSSFTAADMDDFVFFQISWLGRQYAWVIGMDRSSRIASLRHRKLVVDDTMQMYERLLQTCNCNRVEL